jgi:hypothetical protein
VEGALPVGGGNSQHLGATGYSVLAPLHATLRGGKKNGKKGAGGASDEKEEKGSSQQHSVHDGPQPKNGGRCGAHVGSVCDA